VQHVRGDREGDQPRHGSGEQRDRTVGRLLAGGQVARSSAIGGLVAAGELFGRPAASDAAIDGVEAGHGSEP
jgi:hypothetical protein